jgi:8-oxo-dGTP pyrophosphatase MutT (NUDIX family)
VAVGATLTPTAKVDIVDVSAIASSKSLQQVTISWLLVRRRVSIGFIEIMRGKYELRDTTCVQALVDQATLAEREVLLTKGFADLWRDLWNGPASRRYQAEYEQSKAKFDVLRSRGTLATLCKESKTKWTEPEWGFPKGRRSSTETELACALRETYEEAGVHRKDLRVLESPSLLEEYRGSNGICYRHRYWLAEAPSTLEVRMDNTNADQRREISDVRWCSFDEAVALIRDYNTEKLAVLKEGMRRVQG